MTTRISTSTRNLFMALVLVVSPSAFSVPQDGNGNKFVLNFNLPGDPIDCGPGADGLYRDIFGWLQFLEFQPDGNRNVLLTAAHIDFTYTNMVTGEMFEWRDRGIDLEFDTNEDGASVAYVSFTGRAGFWNIIGRGVINLDTGEVVFEAGQSAFGGETGPNAMGVDDFACGVLNNGV